MNNFYNSTLLFLALLLGGCAGTELDRKLAQFLKEEKDPRARYEAGGSYETKMVNKYKSYTCDELLGEYQKQYAICHGEPECKVATGVVGYFAKEKHCSAVFAWEDQKRQQQANDKAARDLLDQERYEERRKWREKQDDERDKAILRQQLKERARQERLLREIRNEG